MADTYQEGAGADFDLSQFYQIFFEEAGENLDQMEQMLLDLDVDAANDEELNGIFRCAHSIKGGSATFGFSDVAELTHQMESLLDRLRRHELQLIPQMVDVLLESADASRSLLARHQAGGQGEAVSTHDLVRRISELAAGAVPAAAPAAAVPAPAPVVAAAPAPTPAVAPVVPAAAVPGGARSLEIHIGPLAQVTLADAIKDLFRDIPGLGSINDLPEDRPGMRRFAVQTTSTDEDLLDLFAFHVAKEQVAIHDAATSAAPAAQEAHEPLEPSAAALAEPYGFFAGAPGVPVEAAPAAAPASAAERPAARAASAEAKGGAQASMESSTIRVAVSKVDQLINLVGELVITQAMLAQNSRGLDAGVYQQLLAGLADLDRNTRDLQESVMSIRMIPMSIVFNRFPRMLRDLAGKLGKKVDFVTHGEATELDKSLVEKITDPLTHLVRNSCDHGIELPQARVQAGKPAVGTITLSAWHQGGSVVIEVRDDGKGLSREKLISKAIERGLQASDSMTDTQVWNLIFEPGFSTAEQVTDVSGRGVGMDVVKKNILGLGGRVDIESAPGCGMSVKVRLPLTLAIMDGMSVAVGDEVYILPLGSVVESDLIGPDRIRSLGNNHRVAKVREEYLPVVDLAGHFGVWRDEPPAQPIMVIVESEGSRAALIVDELIGQQQVVVKNLETHYKRIPHVSGATILGNGRVALILDIATLVQAR